MSKFDTGTASILLNDQILNVKGDITWSTQKTTKETFRSSNGAVGGTKYSPINPMITMKKMEAGDFDTSIFDDMTGVTIVCNERNGKQIIFTDCTQVGEVIVDAIEGEYSVKFESMSGRPKEVLTTA